MKDIIYCPSKTWSNDFIISQLTDEYNNHDTTHVLGCEIIELISLLGKGITYESAIIQLRKGSTSRYANYPKIVS